MSRIVATGHLHIALQAVLGGFKGLLAHEGWHGNRNPCLHGGRLLTLAGADWLQGRFAPARWYGLAASTLGHPRIGGRPQDAAHRGDIPAFPALGCGNLCLAQALGDFV